MPNVLDAHAGQMAYTGALRSFSPGRRSLVVLAPPEAIADCILHALKREFPLLTIELCADFEEVGKEFDDPVSLILVDRSYLLEIDRQFGGFRRVHPGAAVAVMLDDMAEAETLIPMLLACRTLRGIVPMNLKLDLWLSIVGLLMRGGEYVPVALFRACARTRSFGPAGESADPPAVPMTTHAQTIETPALGDLTERERQVLALVARGRQNKLIAMELDLSEHTVKIHIHNVIRKLRVHNRTEAASLFLRAANARSAGAGGQ